MAENAKIMDAQDDYENQPPPLNKRNAFGASTSLVQLKSTKLEAEEEETDLPPKKHRKCTDILMLLTFLLYWVGIIVFTALGLTNGDPTRLVYGSDYSGNVCNSGVNAGKPFLTYPRLELDVLQATTENPLDIKFFGICLSSCPVENEYVCTREAEEAVSKAIVDTGKSRTEVITDCTDNLLAFSEDTLFLTSCENSTIARSCFETLFNMTSFLFRCFPEYVYETELLADETGCIKAKTITTLGITTQICQKFRKVSKLIEEEPTQSNILFDAFNSVSRFLSIVLGDIYKASFVILVVGVLVTGVIGLIYTSSLWLCVGLIVWTSIVLVAMLLICFTLFCYVKGGIVDLGFLNDLQELILLDETVNDLAEKLGIDLQDVDELVGGNSTSNSTSSFTQTLSLVPEFLLTESESYLREFQYAAYTLTGVSIIYFLLVLVLGRRIAKAIEIFGEASHAIRSQPLLLLLPPVQGILAILLTVGGVVSASFLITSGEIIEIPGTNLSLAENTTADFLTTEFGTFTFAEVGTVYIIFGYLWSINFINGVTVMITAGSVATWYWAGGSDHKFDLGASAIIHSTYRTIRYHLGSIAMGSLLIAIVQFIRYTAHYIQAKMKDLKQSNRLVKILICCLNCFLACAEKCVKFISKNGYIMCAIYGKSFCGSSKLAFFAIAHNLAQVATVTFLGDVIVRFGQFLITIACGFIAWIWLDLDPRYALGGSLELESFLTPVLVVMLFAWLISAEILSIYDIAVETIILSYCQDKKLLSLRGKVNENAKTYTRFDMFVKKHGKTDEEYEKEWEGVSIRSF